MAKDAVEKIQKTGGLTRSLDTDLCKEYFFEKPYLARGYLAHLALLISVEQGKVFRGVDSFDGITRCCGND